MVPGEVAAETTRAAAIPTVGIEAEKDGDAQVLVSQDPDRARVRRQAAREEDSGWH